LRELVNAAGLGSRVGWLMGRDRDR
jgi:hypothetical protein